MPQQLYYGNFANLGTITNPAALGKHQASTLIW